MGKNKGGDKKASGGKGGGEQKAEVKGAQSINVRHILVRPAARFFSSDICVFDLLVSAGLMACTRA